MNTNKDVKRTFWLSFSVIASKIDRRFLKELKKNDEEKTLTEKLVRLERTSSSSQELQQHLQDLRRKIQRKSRKLTAMKSTFVEVIIILDSNMSIKTIECLWCRATD